MRKKPAGFSSLNANLPTDHVQVIKRMLSSLRRSAQQLLAFELQELMIELVARHESTPFAGTDKTICCTVDDIGKLEGAPFVSRYDLERAKETMIQNDCAREGLNNRFFISHPADARVEDRSMFFNVDIPTLAAFERAQDVSGGDEPRRQHLPPVTAERIQTYNEGINGAGQDCESIEAYVYKYMSLHHTYYDQERSVFVCAACKDYHHSGQCFHQLISRQMLRSEKLTLSKSRKVRLRGVGRNRTETPAGSKKNKGKSLVQQRGENFDATLKEKEEQDAKERQGKDDELRKIREDDKEKRIKSVSDW